jgi:hypothetical protein
MEKKDIEKAYHEYLVKAIESFEKKTSTKSTVKLMKSLSAKKDEEGSDPDIKLWHFSKKSGIKEIDPNFQGSGVRGKDIVRESSPVTWFYRDGTPTESVVTKNSVSKYLVKIPKDSKIYDVHEDPHGYWEKAKAHRDSLLEKSEGGETTVEKSVIKHFFDMIKNDGYAGYCGSKGPLPGVVGLFNKTVPEKEIQKPKHNDASWSDAEE